MPRVSWLSLLCGPGTGSNTRSPLHPLTTGVAERLTRLCALRPTILELANEGGSPCVFEAHIGVCQLQRCGTPYISRSCVEWDCQATDLRIQRGRSRQRIGHPC